MTKQTALAVVPKSMLHEAARVLYVCLNATECEFRKTMFGWTPGLTTRTFGADAVAEVERAASQGTPYQVVLLQAISSTERLVVETGRQLLSTTQPPFLILVSAAAVPSVFREKALELGERAFVMGKSFQAGEQNLIRLVAKRWDADRSLAEIREAAETSLRTSKLVDPDVHLQKALP